MLLCVLIFFLICDDRLIVVGLNF